MIATPWAEVARIVWYCKHSWLRVGRCTRAVTIRPWNFGTGAILRARDIFFCLSPFSW